MSQTHSRTMAELGPGEHLCCLYATEVEHQAILTSFMRQGLERDEKVLYVLDSRCAETILDYLRDDGLDAGSYLARGQLNLLTVRDISAGQSLLDARRVIEWLEAEVERARANDYTSLWVTSEMTWTLWKLPGQEKLIEYEARLNEFISSSRCTCLCQYDRRRFAPRVLLNALQTHPSIAVGIGVYDNPRFASLPELKRPRCTSI